MQKMVIEGGERCQTWPDASTYPPGQSATLVPGAGRAAGQRRFTGHSYAPDAGCSALGDPELDLVRVEAQAQHQCRVCEQEVRHGLLARNPGEVPKEVQHDVELGRDHLPLHALRPQRTKHPTDAELLDVQQEVVDDASVGDAIDPVRLLAVQKALGNAKVSAGNRYVERLDLGGMVRPEVTEFEPARAGEVAVTRCTDLVGGPILNAGWPVLR